MLEILVFSLGTARYALPSADVDGLVRMVATTPLPRAPAIVEGVIDVHGEILPVLDVRARFGLAPRAPRLTDRLILAKTGGRRVALRCDDVTGLVRVEPNPGSLAHVGPAASAQLAGVATLADGLVLIHDLKTFLSEAEAEALDAALSA